MITLVALAVLGIGQVDLNGAAVQAKARLEKKYGPGEARRIDAGLRQVRRMWRREDGTPSEFLAFAVQEFLPKADLDVTFQRLEFALERADGYLHSLVRDLRRGEDLEIGPMLGIDYRLGAFEPTAHLSEDLFRSKIAFIALLNFPVTTLKERLANGGKWSRRQWAEVRLGQRFAVRESAEANERIAKAYAGARAYVSSYNIYTHNLLTKDGRRLFPAGQRLLSHWNLRDEIKANYGEPNGLEKQRMLARVMEGIVQQTIPAAAINNPRRNWTPEKLNSRDREKDERYRHWLEVFRAEKTADGLDPLYPTYLDRRFARDSEVTEGDAERLMVSVLDSPVVAKVSAVIAKRLGRKLEPFDIFYSGFAPSAEVDKGELEGKVWSMYPNPEAFSADIPRMLRTLGFSAEKTEFLASRIVVEPARGSGHAMGFMRRDDNAHLRTRFEPGGMDYKGYNIAVHEMGHNVEQIFSTATIDYMSLRGVPNTAFTEALAFVFQARDRELLGVGSPGASATHALNEYWEARQMAGMALVDLRAWRWLYAHPGCSPSEFRAAVVGIAQSVWNRWYAPYLSGRDSSLLGIYSHMVDSGLYLPDYLFARVIAFQIEAHFAGLSGPMGVEFERLARIGCLTPDAWMRQAVGTGVSAGPLLRAVSDAAGGRNSKGAG